MLETLLESRSNGRRSVGGAIVSVTTHTALIGAALYATAQARVETPRITETVHPVYFSPTPDQVPIASPTTRQYRPQVSRRLQFIEPHIDINVPTVDMTSVVSRPGDFDPTAIVAAIPKGGGSGPTSPAGGPFRSDQVDRQVAVVPGNAPPRYPDLLRSSGVEGQVTAVFVVDEHGRAEEGSIRFTRSDNRLFEDAVREGLRRMRFIPAEVGGRKVKQLVQMPFVFTLAR